MKRILISGGNGFLGSYLVRKALEEGFEVTVVDDFSTSREVQIPKKANIIKEHIENYRDDNNYDYVAHLAARPSPEDYTTHPVDTILSNSIGTKVMLDIAVKSKAIFMYTSSSEIYGEAEVIPTPESYYGYVNPNGIRSCYDESKRYSEALIMAYHRQYDLDVRIQRPFNVYGPRIRPDGQYGRVIPRFIDQAIRMENLTVHGDGTQTRSFLFVEDWMEATWKLQTMEDLAGTFTNIGSSEQISVLDLAKDIIRLTGSSSRITHTEKRVDDPTRRSADLGRVGKLLNWYPKTKLEDGLNSTIAWLKGKSI